MKGSISAILEGLHRPVAVAVMEAATNVPVTVQNCEEYTWEVKDTELVLKTLDVKAANASLVWGKKGSGKMSIVDNKSGRVLAVIQPIFGNYPWFVIGKMGSFNKEMTYKSLKTALGQIKKGLDAIAKSSDTTGKDKQVKMGKEQRSFEDYYGSRILKVNNKKKASIKDMEDAYTLTPAECKAYSDKIIDAIDGYETKIGVSPASVGAEDEYDIGPVSADLKKCTTVGDFRDVFMKYKFKFD